MFSKNPGNYPRFLGIVPRSVECTYWRQLKTSKIGTDVHLCKSKLKSRLTSVRRQECPLRLLGGSSWDTLETVYIQYTFSKLEFSNWLRVSCRSLQQTSCFKNTIDSSQEFRTSSQTPWRTLWRHLEDRVLLRQLRTSKSIQSFLVTCILHSCREIHH